MEAFAQCRRAMEIQLAELDVLESNLRIEFMAAHMDDDTNPALMLQRIDAARASVRALNDDASTLARAKADTAAAVVALLSTQRATIDKLHAKHGVRDDGSASRLAARCCELTTAPTSGGTSTAPLAAASSSPAASPAKTASTRRPLSNMSNRNATRVSRGNGGGGVKKPARASARKPLTARSRV
jgi:hypothetical protein